MDVVKQLRYKIGSMIHSDRGWTYTSPKKDVGAVQSMSRKGNCRDNASMENFFGRLKSEAIYQESRNCRGYGFNDMEKIGNDSVAWYNEARISKKLRYQSPVQYRQSIA